MHDIIKKHEGFRAHPYRCPAGYPTIGYGNRFYPDGREVTMNDREITEKQMYRYEKAEKFDTR